MVKENRRHGSDILMAETQIRPREAGVARFDRFDPYFRNSRAVLGSNHVPRKYFLRQRHGVFRSLDRWKAHFSLQACDVELKESAVFDNLPRDLVFAGGKFR